MEWTCGLHQRVAVVAASRNEHPLVYHTSLSSLRKDRDSRRILGPRMRSMFRGPLGVKDSDAPPSAQDGVGPESRKVIEKCPQSGLPPRFGVENHFPGTFRDSGPTPSCAIGASSLQGAQVTAGQNPLKLN